MSKERTLFKTPYGDRERVTTEPGCKIQNVYGYEIDNYGRKILVKTGEENLYEMIQMSLEETKIENILKRAAAGENVFRPEGIYADITTMPSNLIEARQSIQKLENTWAKLPSEIKNKYNNSVEEFISRSGSEEWLTDMGLLKNQAKEVKEAITTDKAPAPATADTLGQVKEATTNE